MRLLWLAEAFRDAGLVVVEEPGWQDRGKDWTDLVGMLQHHTACCMPYPVHKLYPTRAGQWRIRANFSVQPGPGNPNVTPAKIHVIAAGACNYSSGVGSRKVLQETRQNIAPIEDAARRRLPNTTASGNRHFINNETAHRSDGSPIPVPMLETIDIAWYIIAKELGLHPNRLISHAEWTRRKIDPRWNGMRSHQIMNLMRARLKANLAGGAPPTIPIPPLEVTDMYLPLKYGDGYTDPPADSEYAGQDRGHRKGDVQYLQLIAGSGVDAGFYGANTATDIASRLGYGDGRTVGYKEWDDLIAGRYTIEGPPGPEGDPGPPGSEGPAGADAPIPTSLIPQYD